ncbi:Na+/H+ antiporter subunit E [Blastococcus sp. PRF04-17]|uniref:Na+/H+ antiporter subunit E n=1 Tax=Blastococcus sp. PRF04-17 TaxID=2933797 RepID=UPI001FF6F8E7|nr:Na+/H+ antiporter subunit E [Blastococcus sp. PRF04-17]UOY00102.1 Na+/H+ antiporter subunit E [Blastococcus sp. PRF04-17]
MTGDAPTAPGFGSRLRHQLPLLVWLVLVWNLLWGTWSWANLLGGLVVALAVMLLLPLPPVVGGARVRPVALVAFAGYFVLDLVRSGALVAWQTVRPRGIGRSAIISVQLRTDSDLLLTILAESLTLVPGSMVIDLDRERRTIALHVLHVDDEDEVERQRASVLAQEARVVRAFGSADDVAALQSAPPENAALENEAAEGRPT